MVEQTTTTKAATEDNLLPFNTNFYQVLYDKDKKIIKIYAYLVPPILGAPLLYIKATKVYKNVEKLRNALLELEKEKKDLLDEILFNELKITPSKEENEEKKEKIIKELEEPFRFNLKNYIYSYKSITLVPQQQPEIK